MSRLITVIAGALLLLAAPQVGLAAPSTPRARALWLDARLAPSATYSVGALDELQSDQLLSVNVDLGRVLPLDELTVPTFATGNVIPPELPAFYVAASQAKDQALYYIKTSTTPPLLTFACVEVTADEWSLKGDGASAVYRCPTKQSTVGEQLDQATGGRWVLGTPRTSTTGAALPGVEIAAELGQLRKMSPVSAVSVSMSVDGAPAETRAATLVNGVYRVSLPLRAGRVAVEVEMRRGEDVMVRPLDPFEVVDVDDHSLVRIQAELTVADRGRAVGFAVAATPVLRDFFTTEGPWHRGCHLLCTISPVVVLRLSTDQGTVAQLGFGLGVFINRAFQINGGLLFGTNNLSSAWRIEDSVFAGIGVDPFLLSEMISASKRTGANQ